MSDKTKNYCTCRCEAVQFCTPKQTYLLLSEGSGRTLVLLIRHGVTDWNMEIRLQGRKDIPLNDKGIEQALITANVVADALRGKLTPGGVFSSPLSRAYDTAAYISDAMACGSPIVLDGLLEWDYGSLEGMTYSERQRRYKDADYPDDIEPVEEATSRIKKALGEVRRRADGESAVVVTHGGVLNLLFSCITRGRAGAGGNITANCTVSLAAVGNKDIIPIAYNLSGEALIEYINGIDAERSRDGETL